MMAFLPLLTARGSVFQLENSVKYFLVQAVASLWFFFSLTLASLFTVRGAIIVAALAIVVKLGLAPCHT